MKEKTFGLIKPDATERRIVGEILAVIESECLEIVGVKMLRLERKDAEQIYSQYLGLPFFDDLIDYLVSGRVVAFVVEGGHAVARMNELVGDVSPSRAQFGTLRNLFGQSKLKNSVHCSKTREAADREIAMIFG